MCISSYKAKYFSSFTDSKSFCMCFSIFNDTHLRNGHTVDKYFKQTHTHKKTNNLT